MNCQACGAIALVRTHECFLCKKWLCYDCTVGVMVMNDETKQLQPKYRCKNRKACHSPEH